MTLSFHIPAHFFSIFCLLYKLSKSLSKNVFTNHCFQRDFLIDSNILISFYVTYCSFPNPIYSFPLVYLFLIGFPYFSVAFSHLLPPCWLPFMPCTLPQFNSSQCTSTSSSQLFLKEKRGPQRFHPLLQLSTCSSAIPKPFHILLTEPQGNSFYGFIFWFYWSSLEFTASFLLSKTVSIRWKMDNPACFFYSILFQLNILNAFYEEAHTPPSLRSCDSSFLHSAASSFEFKSHSGFSYKNADENFKSLVAQLKLEINSNLKLSLMFLARTFQDTVLLKSLLSTGPGLWCGLRRH